MRGRCGRCGTEERQGEWEQLEGDLGERSWRAPVAQPWAGSALRWRGVERCWRNCTWQGHGRDLRRVGEAAHGRDMGRVERCGRDCTWQGHERVSSSVL
eukprot:351624-Chlamydomonas_euryale.AAC.6